MRDRPVARRRRRQPTSAPPEKVRAEEAEGKDPDRGVGVKAPEILLPLKGSGGVKVARASSAIGTGAATGNEHQEEEWQPQQDREAVSDASSDNDTDLDFIVEEHLSVHVPFILSIVSKCF